MDDSTVPARKSFLEEMEPYLARNEMQAVLDLAQDRLQKIPEDLDARVAVCRAWLQQGRIDEARDMVQEIEEILSGLSHLYACMGDLYIKKGLATEAELFYRKFAALNPAPSPSAALEERPENPAEFSETNDDDGEDDDGSDIAPGFETATLAELYLRQGHIQMAREMLEKITGREPMNDRAKGLLEDIRHRGGEGENIQTSDVVIAELSRWIDNLGKLRRHAG